MNNSKNKVIEQVKSDFTEYIIKKGQRKTPERYAILECVYETKGHFDVESLYDKMKLGGFRVSCATLYNTMELLTDSGLVVKHQFGDNIAQYEKAYGNENHAHIICLSCGKIKENKSLNFDFTTERKIKQFKISYYNLYIYGVCSACEKVKKKEQKTIQ